MSDAWAQATLTLPDTSQTTAMYVDVSEQARIFVPAFINFNVTNVAAQTAASPVSVSIDRIVLASPVAQLRVSVRSNAPSFTPPSDGALTWTAEDLSWTAAAWTAAGGAAGTLSSTAYSAIATCDASATACSTAALVFTLAAKPAVQRSGTHTLVVTWKLESIGS